MTAMRAIDVYSGVGGWSLGLRLAGIKVVGSYEWWGPANETNFRNNKHRAQTIDVRTLSLKNLPKRIDLVVGSPPCTQFSYANRGGNGDVADGLQDLIRFFEIVAHVRPRFWAMENVPRIAAIIDAELRKGGALYRFRQLGIQHRVINMEAFGLPQRRSRCIVGNFDFALLDSYRDQTDAQTLGGVVSALDKGKICDPNYGIILDRRKLTEHAIEEPLNDEETRINRAAKRHHPVYNQMPFPDSSRRASRTVTATCTRVSRESIVIRDANGRYRRLTLRERACLQGFPITFQFYGKSHAQKLRMIGNAMPPPMAYFIAHAMKGTPKSRVPLLTSFAKSLVSPEASPKETRPETAGRRYPENRRFRFAIPNLRLSSGVRFELSNHFDNASTEWTVDFYYGSSKSIQSIDLGRPLLRPLLAIVQRRRRDLLSIAKEAEVLVSRSDITNMQSLWSHRGPGVTRAFDLLDEVGALGARMRDAFSADEELAKELVSEALRLQMARSPIGEEKLLANSATIASGLLIGSAVNAALDEKSIPSTRKSRRAIVSSHRIASSDAPNSPPAVAE
ncbi:MAG: DNA (cytosine-5-)-methyltransferase [Hyphomonadaceae bacterium]|nr:DNA (cytosine-5-)-methyltransferase [Hyphomonadaceae bacterium]